MSMLADLADFDRRAIALALYRMLTGPTYDISAVRQSLRVCGQSVADRTPGFNTLRLHHCSRFDAMPDGFARDLAAQTLGLFHDAAPQGDGFMKELAAAAGLDPKDAPTDVDAFHRPDAQPLPVSGDGQVGTAPAIA